MIGSFLLGVALIVLIIFTIMLANRLKVAYPVLLVVLGLLLALIPGLPTVHLNPELVFFIFLPPLLYEAAWSSSWKDLWKWRRIIGSFAFLVVFLTAAVVALAVNAVIPGFSLALGFLLGGIVSPPDAVSAAAILKFVKVPRRFATILEGESLFNDAASLVIFRFAALTVTTGQFVWYTAAGQFVWMMVGGVGVGVLLAMLFMRLHRYLPTDTSMDILLTLIAPYIMYLAAEEVHASGVLATVAGGLFMSVRRYTTFSAATRVRAVNVWECFVFVLNGLVFVLIGLDLPEILEGLERDHISPLAATGYGVSVTVLLIVVRLAASYGAVVVTQVMKHFITVADERVPSRSAPLVLGWAGMRGVVSLAAALSIPVMAGDVAFPQRSLIIYITFVVIFLTLVVQGLTLPWLIRRANLEETHDYLPENETLQLIRRRLAQAALDYTEQNFSREEIERNIHLAVSAQEWSFHAQADAAALSHCNREVFRGILDAQRAALDALNRREDIDESVLRKFYLRLDLEDEKWRG